MVADPLQVFLFPPTFIQQIGWHRLLALVKEIHPLGEFYNVVFDSLALHDVGLYFPVNHFQCPVAQQVDFFRLGVGLEQRVVAAPFFGNLLFFCLALCFGGSLFVGQDRVDFPDQQPVPVQLFHRTPLDVLWLWGLVAVLNLPTLVDPLVQSGSLQRQRKKRQTQQGASHLN